MRIPDEEPHRNVRCAYLCATSFFDRAVRTVREYPEKVEYIHLNPVKAGWVSRPEDWAWSSVHDYTGVVNDAPVTPSGLSVDRVLLATDPRTRI